LWIWVLTFTILGSNPEHGQIAKFETKQECQIALQNKINQERLKGRETAATCIYKKVEGQGWW
jgi:hypothetical protein